MKKLGVLFLFLFIGIISAQSSIENIPIVKWSKDKTIYEVNIRQYTKHGTFKEFEKHLPRLQKMGTGILWLMPVQPIGIKNRKGTLGSYYSIQNYTETNPEFGTMKDFKNMVKSAHQKGMYIILDWVANHTSWDNVWIKSNPEFYSKDKDGNFMSPVADWADVMDLNYENKDLWKAMIEAMKFWVKECDIDGFRCDVAGMVPAEFWVEARKELDKVKKVFMLAEATEPHLHNKAFDMTYSWQLKDLMNAVAKGEKNAKDIISQFEKEKTEYGQKSLRMLFTTNHDENSWNGTEYERLGDGAETFAVLCGVSKDMLLFYSGQEAGLNRRLAFFEKDSIEWKENKFATVFTSLNKLKKENPALWNGEFGSEMKFIANGNDNVITFVREKGKSKVFAVINLSKNEQNITIDDKLIKGNYKNYFTKEKMVLTHKYEITLKPWQYQIFVKN